jgi:UDP-3-O-[3-hydroxymyristoyl] glucosamine N-acyltransferase
MKKLLIFGIGEQCSRVLFEAERIGAYEVLGFVTVGPCSTSEFMGRPVWGIEAVRSRFRRHEVFAFACDGNRYLNQDRLGLYVAAKRTGFEIISLVSVDSAVAASVRIRENVFVDAQVQILGGCNVGANASIMHGSTLSSGVKVGTSCWIGPLSQIGHGAVLQKNCTLGHYVIVSPNVTVPAWSIIGDRQSVAATPCTSVFWDPMFRSQVELRGAVRK